MGPEIGGDRCAQQTGNMLCNHGKRMGIKGKNDLSHRMWGYGTSHQTSHQGQSDISHQTKYQYDRDTIPLYGAKDLLQHRYLCLVHTEGLALIAHPKYVHTISNVLLFLPLVIHMSFFPIPHEVYSSRTNVMDYGHNTLPNVPLSSFSNSREFLSYSTCSI